MKSLFTAISLCVVLLCSLKVIAKENAMIESTMKNSKLSWSAFFDAYYSIDFSTPQDHEKPPFLFNHNR